MLRFTTAARSCTYVSSLVRRKEQQGHVGMPYDQNGTYRAAHAGQWSRRHVHASGLCNVHYSTIHSTGGVFNLTYVHSCFLSAAKTSYGTSTGKSVLALVEGYQCIYHAAQPVQISRRYALASYTAQAVYISFYRCLFF